MRVVVTGGAGFIGSHLVDGLVGCGHDVVVIDNLSSGRRELVNPAAELVVSDIATRDLASIFERHRPEALFHLAAQIDVRKSVADPAWDAEQNIIGSLRLFELCRQYGTHVIFSSSGGAMYGDAATIPTPESTAQEPISPYGVAKLTIEKYLHYYYVIHGVIYTALRYANVYGPRQNGAGEGGVVAIFSDRLLRQQSITIFGDGNQTRDFVYVEDVVAANLAALERKVIGACNIGTGKETTVNQLASMMQQLTVNARPVQYANGRAGEQQRSCLAINMAQQLLGWRPEYSLEQGLQKTVDWFKQELAKSGSTS